MCDERMFVWIPGNFKILFAIIQKSARYCFEEKKTDEEGGRRKTEKASSTEWVTGS